jgi:hypothetical protein
MYNQIYLSISLIAALFIYLLDYGFGKPGDEKPNYQSLLFFWSFYLAKKRLKKMQGWNTFQQQLDEQLATADTLMQKARVIASFKEIVFLTARPFFTYEMILGMCPICTHFWVSLLFFSTVNIFCFKVNIITFGLSFLLSHLFLRIAKKF